MKHLTILVPDGQPNLSSVFGAYKLFDKANEYWEMQTGRRIFRIQLAGISANVELDNGLFAVKPESTVDAIGKTDLVIIPALHDDIGIALKRNDKLVQWVKDQYIRGAEVASICTGAFLLAATGLLNGKMCSTHWMSANLFRNMFPEATLVADRLITDESGLYTNGGAFSFLNLMLYLVEKFYDRPTAIYCAKVFQIDIERNSQLPFTIFSGQKDHNDELIKKAQILIEGKLQERLSFEHLAGELAISRRNFDRRFIKATGTTPVEYQQRVKIEAAKQALETSRKTVQEVMYEVGYSDQKAFRELFKKMTGLSPLEYRNRYNKEALAE